MSKLRKWLCTSLLTVVATAPVMAGSDDAVPANNGTGTNATAAEPAPSPALNPTSAINNSNVTALLGVLVMKGVLAPSEANAIQGAAPEAEFQLLVEALTKKGLLSAADVAAATPAAQPATAAVSESIASPATQSGQAATTPMTPQTEKPVPRTVVAAIAPVRVNPVDPPVKGRAGCSLQVGPGQDDALRFRQSYGGSRLQ